MQFCQLHAINWESEVPREQLPPIVARLKIVDQGLGLSKEEESWALRQAFKNRATLAFSKKELGMCSRVTFDIELKDP